MFNYLINTNVIHIIQNYNIHIIVPKNWDKMPIKVDILSPYLLFFLKLYDNVFLIKITILDLQLQLNNYKKNQFIVLSKTV